MPINVRCNICRFAVDECEEDYRTEQTRTTADDLTADIGLKMDLFKSALYGPCGGDGPSLAAEKQRLIQKFVTVQSRHLRMAKSLDGTRVSLDEVGWELRFWPCLLRF